MMQSKLNKIDLSVFFFSVSGYNTLQAQTKKNSHNWTATPTMGWNSWDCDITGVKKLYLVVNDGDHKTDWDHANWIAPILDSLKLTSVKWKIATSGWQKPKLNHSISSNSLITNKIKYENDIGTHSNSIIEFDIPEGYTRFKSQVGLDEACVFQNTGASVKFFVFTQDHSGPPPSVKITTSLSSNPFLDTYLITDLWSEKCVGTF